MAQTSRGKKIVRRKANKKKKVKQSIKRNRASYSIEQKKEVVTYAKEHSMVGRWVTASKNWTTETNEKSKRVGAGRKAFYPEAEKKLYVWIIEQRKRGLAVTYATIKNKMLEILNEQDMVFLYGNLTEGFKTSHRWVVAFMKWYKLAL